MFYIFRYVLRIVDWLYVCVVELCVCDRVMFSVNEVWRSTPLMKLLLIPFAKKPTINFP
jgi:hypothetical protein